ncbi:MAG: hypothetical protein CVU11_05170 [Bacteroidetes bacterium HGW-Bacteroidetes-6]|jgi:formylglycine-generating enzyme required for sulfatase activity|nr:MAG: hypothetical protein CVU11_05170 [Bacteroidetes bacterium HGW-Bacteroidetes-6]
MTILTEKDKTMIKKQIALSVTLVFLSLTLWANNVQVDNVTRSGVGRNIISFELSWENSWYFSAIPRNHDAVWLFIKYRECGGGGPWHHALLSTNMADHFFDTDITYARPITVNDRFGNPGNHNTGVLVRRANYGGGDIVSQSISLTVSGASDGILLADTAEYDIKVMAIEMVQIPESPFYAGDGVSTYTMFQYGTGSGTPYGAIPYRFTAENGTDTIDYGYSNYWVKLNSDFPKGYAEFYVMKYEISQGQYVDFLNTIDPGAALNRSYIYNGYMYNIGLSGTYTTIHPNRAMIYMSTNDLFSYLDWAALRPMSELEYEKASRGPKDFVPGEFAWGDNYFIEANNIINTATGTEICTDSAANLNCGTSTYLHGGNFGANGYGPVEVGIFARDSTLSRAATGGSYYGVMELSGNAKENCVQINTNQGNPATTSSYTGVWGDGQLNNIGFSNTSAWPAAGTYFILRGGYWWDAADRCRISDRNNRNVTTYDTRGYDYGGRGVR